MDNLVLLIPLIAIGIIGYKGLQFFYHHYADKKEAKKQAATD